MLEKWGARAETTGIECVWNVCHGRPWEKVLEAADEFDIDLVVIGQQGRATKRREKSAASSNASSDRRIDRR